MSSGWGCINEDHGQCKKVRGFKCDPGMKGCVLAGRFTFSNHDKNFHRNKKKGAETGTAPRRSTVDVTAKIPALRDPDD